MSANCDSPGRYVCFPRQPGPLCLPNASILGTEEAEIVALGRHKLETCRSWQT